MTSKYGSSNPIEAWTSMLHVFPYSKIFQAHYDIGQSGRGQRLFEEASSFSAIITIATTTPRNPRIDEAAITFPNHPARLDFFERSIQGGYRNASRRTTEPTPPPDFRPHGSRCWVFLPATGHTSILTIRISYFGVIRRSKG